MARIRSVKPEVRTSLTVASWPIEVRYAWILLWGYLDDFGRGVDDTRLLVADMFPLDRNVTERRMAGWLEIWTKAGIVCRYEIDGRSYLHAVNWGEHQKISHPSKSRIPPCLDHFNLGGDS